MSVYTPDVWVVVKITSPKHGEIYKILAGWYGGFAGSDSWQMNSGIVSVVDAGGYWEVHGTSGSTYICHKESERMSGYTMSIFNSFVREIESRGDGYSFDQVDAHDAFKQFIGTLAQG